MNHITAQRIRDIADTALDILERETLRSAKAFIAHQCDESAFHAGVTCGLEFAELEAQFQAVITCSTKARFRTGCAKVRKVADQEIKQISIKTRTHRVLSILREQNLIVTEADARQAVDVYEDVNKAVEYLLKQEPAFTSRSGEATPDTCRRQAEHFRKMGDTRLAKIWETEAVILEIVIAGGCRDAGLRYVYKYGNECALAAYLEDKQGSLDYFQKDYQMAREEMVLAGGELGDTTKPLSTRPERLDAFAKSVQRHRIARMGLLLKVRENAKAHDPQITTIINAAIQGDYLPADIETRIIGYCLRLTE